MRKKINGKTNLKTWLVMAVILLGFCCAIAAGDVIYVDADASPGGDGASWGTAYKYLQDALYKPPTGGDQIWVAVGTYKPDANTANPSGTSDWVATFQLINGVALYGGFAGNEDPCTFDLADRDFVTNETILSGDLNGDDVGFTNNGDNSYHVTTGSGTDANAVLDGFTITAGNANGSNPYNKGGGMYNNSGSPMVVNCTFSGNSAQTYGGGMYNEDYSSPTVSNCTFSGNSAEQRGGGMYNDYSSPTVTNCTFSGDSAGNSGGGMNNYYGNPTVSNCTFSGNSAYTGGGMYNGPSSPTLNNCVFSGNAAAYGGGMYNEESGPTVTNCTFSGNSAYSGGGMWNVNGSSPTVTNCILWGDTAPSAPEIYNGAGSSTTVSYSDVQGGYGGNMDAAPLFVNASGPDNIFGTGDDDLRLSPGSPCIDAGDNTAVPAGVTTDLDGNPRFVDDPATTNTGNGIPPIVDMGAYEYQPSVIFVDAGATGANNGCSWADAYKYFQNALADSAASGKNILVAEGIYKPDQTTANPGGTGSRTETFMPVSDVGVYGGYQAGGTWLRDPDTYETILSGDLAGDDVGFTNNGENSYHVVTASGVNANAVLDGFTITAGNADDSDPYNKGGGMYNDEGSPKLVNCNITNNSAGSNGGGMYIGSGNPTLVNCIFSGNGANMGGGLSTSASSSVTVVNCVFTANSGGNSGGGILSNGSLIVTNSVFYRNQVTPGMGGAISNWTDSALTLQNSILWSNLPDQISVLAGSSAPVVTHSDVQDGYGGTGNIDDDPLFKDADGPDDVVGTEDDNLELAYDSPCIDAGDSNSVPADIADLDGDGNTAERIPLDLAGNPRFTDDPLTDDTGVPATGYPKIVDMGAYERYEFCGDAGHPFPVGDFNRDCNVNFLDIAIIAAHWLEDAGPE